MDATNTPFYLDKKSLPRNDPLKKETQYPNTTYESIVILPATFMRLGIVNSDGVIEGRWVFAKNLG